MDYTERLEDTLFILSGADDDDSISDKILDFFSEAESFRTFGEALSDLVNQKYGNLSEESAKDMLKRCAKEKGIKLNRNTINNWFSGLRPKKGDQSRENMFLIAFALELSYEDTQRLFTKVYYDRPFDLRNPREFIYWFCIITGRSFQIAENMIEKISLQSEQERDNTVFTTVLRAEIEMGTSEEEIINYINSHPHNFTINSRSAKAALNRLLNEIKGRDEERLLLKQGMIDETCSYISRECALDERLLDVNKSLSSISSMIDIILGINRIQIEADTKKSWFKNVDFPQEIISRFPTKHSFSKEDLSAEELRKTIILLFSYKFWFEQQYENSETDLDDYYAQLNEILDSVGLQTLYYGNPFDWMFLFCSYYENPLDRFRDIMKEAFSWE